MLFLSIAGSGAGLDPTVIKLIRFCKKENIQRFQIKNLWTYRTPQPPKLFEYWQKVTTPDENDEKDLLKEFPEVSDGKCEKICVAWGQLGNKNPQFGGLEKCSFRNFKIKTTSKLHIYILIKSGSKKG